MKEPKEQVDIITKFLKSLIKEDTIPDNIIVKKVDRENNETQEDIKTEDIVTLLSVTNDLPDYTYTIIYFPLIQERIILFGFMESDGYLVWEFSMDKKTLCLTDINGDALGGFKDAIQSN